MFTVTAGGSQPGRDRSSHLRGKRNIQDTTVRGCEAFCTEAYRLSSSGKHFIKS